MSLLEELDDYKLETSFEKDPYYVVHTSYQADRKRGRKVTVTERWSASKEALGTGTFSTVRLEYLIGDNKNSQRAVKQLRKDHLARLRIDYKKELLALTKFSRKKFTQHQIFVEFYGWFDDDDHIFIAMEYFPYGTLDKFINADFKESDARRISLQLLEGLQIMHEESFTHRDLKPQNIFVVQKSPWWVKIGDFGISKRVSNNDTALHTATGTPHYLAPEVYQYIEVEDEESNTYTNAVDIWSLGCVVYQMLALQVPFPAYPRNLKAFCKGGAFPEEALSKRASPLAIQFVKKLMVPIPNLRPSAKEAKEFWWLRIPDSSYLHKFACQTILDTNSGARRFGSQQALYADGLVKRLIVLEKGETEGKPTETGEIVRPIKGIKLKPKVPWYDMIKAENEKEPKMTVLNPKRLEEGAAYAPQLLKGQHQSATTNPKSAEGVGEPAAEGVDWREGLGNLKFSKLNGYRQKPNSIKTAGENVTVHANKPSTSTKSRMYGSMSHEELEARIAEAKTSAQLLVDMLNSTPRSELENNDLVKEFVERCHSADKSLMSFLRDNGNLEAETTRSLCGAASQSALARQRYLDLVMKELDPSYKLPEKILVRPVPTSDYVPPPRTSGLAPNLSNLTVDAQGRLLPQGWEGRTTESGQLFFVDHETKTTCWNTPLDRFHPRSPYQGQYERYRHNGV